MSNLPIDKLPSDVSLSISSLPSNVPLIVDGSNLRVGRIDRDMMAHDLLQFNITAVHSSGRQLAHSSVFITVEDINDNTPIFSQTNYTFGLTKKGADEKNGGVFVGRVRVGDDDATSPFNTVNLYTRDPRLRIDEDGNVYTTKQIRDGEMVVRIFASDGGTPNKTASTIVQVRIMEEERITVTPEQKSIDWSESGKQSKRYSLLRLDAPLYSQEEVKEWIEIDNKNGSISILKQIPATEVSLFILIKGDQDESPRNVILLFPHNDVLSFTEREYTVFVSRLSNESIIDTSLVSRVDNATYTLDGFSSPSPFSVDSKGSVFWSSLAEFPSTNWLNGSIQVRDLNGRTDQVPLNIRFHSSNLHAPQFSSSSFVIFVPLRSPIGKVLPLPFPPAVDLDPQDSLVYSI
ncbi:hypothetical protein PFISCL1PPCAC_13637, partial [Pristionchus fissidentatus]